MDQLITRRVYLNAQELRVQRVIERRFRPYYRFSSVSTDVHFMLVDGLHPDRRRLHVVMRDHILTVIHQETAMGATGWTN